MNKTFGSTLVVLMMLAGCKERNAPIDPSEADVITTVILTLTDSSTMDVSEFLWEDIDGVGGNEPNRIDTMRIALGKLYSGTIELENRSVTPIENVTTDVYNLQNEHQFFFSVTNGVATVEASDIDDRGLPIGLMFSVTPATPGTGLFTIALSHYDSRAAKDGVTPSNETDISVTFPLIVE